MIANVDFFFFLHTQIQTKQCCPRNNYDARVQVSVFVRARVQLLDLVRSRLAGIRGEKLPLHNTGDTVAVGQDTSSLVLRRTCFLREAMINRNLKNTLVISVGFLFLFTASGGLQNLQVRRPV